MPLIGQAGYPDSFRLDVRSGRPEDKDKDLKKRIFVRPDTTVAQLKEMGRYLFAPIPASRIEVHTKPNPCGVPPFEISKKHCRAMLRDLRDRAGCDELVFYYDDEVAQGA